jgi:glycosyltransferase involved in cell wall biosynthesis
MPNPFWKGARTVNEAGMTLLSHPVGAEVPPSPAQGTARTKVAGKFLERGGRQLRVQGVTYGPFGANADGHPFPDPAAAADDLRLMGEANINSIRTYHVPPDWLLSLADEHGITVLIDVPWRKHVCFLDVPEAQQEARAAVRAAAKRGQSHPCVLAYSIGNEISQDLVRWYGPGRVERFLRELMDVAKQADPNGLVTYTSYPPTEYLDVSFLDFATFNVYLHDRDAFRRYLFRLQNLVGDKPLVLGELGMDTIRNGEAHQAEFLAGHMAEARLMGLAGAFAFAWTDDWHTGGHAITDWAFGITDRQRSPKAAYDALQQVYGARLPSLLSQTPRVSVVVCTYNGGRTLEQCLCSLRALDYPDYEVIVVDDGSTDATRAILGRFPEVRAIHQANQGLSVARNVGLQAATGEVVAYTDSDCFADPAWLSLLVYQLQHSDAAAVGGPNLTPADGWSAACVASSPGQPTHVLESDQVAEHVPGCNMAFRRDALLAINGFDPVYRKAGDDVDVCWRLQQAGHWITFAPGAFVWHHRRQGPRAYLKQQAGYGEAEALLQFKHPDKFNGRGDSKWRGILYGAGLKGLCLGQAVIYRGTFGRGLFQSIYQPGAAHWAMLPSTLEWHLAAALIALASLAWPIGWPVAALMLALSLTVAVLQACQARLEPEYEGLLSRAVVAALCYAQPLVRSWARYRQRFRRPHTPCDDAASRAAVPARVPLSGLHEAAYWDEEWRERIDLLHGVIAHLGKRRWGTVIDAGWAEWDLKVFCGRWVITEVATTQEDHGGGKRLIRVRYRQQFRDGAKLLVVVGMLGAAAAMDVHVALGAGILVLLWGSLCVLWWRGTRLAAKVAAVFDFVATDMKMTRCCPKPTPAGDARRTTGMALD